MNTQGLEERTVRSPQISVLVPVYNGARYLSHALDCILNQSFDDFEVLVIDDGSTDTSGAVVRAFCDSRIRYFRQDHKGLCHALNRGIEEARAPFLARNDQDDLSLSERLERQLAILRQRPEAVALFAHYEKFGSKRAWRNADKQGRADASVFEIDPIRHGCLLGSTMLARTEALRQVGGYRQAFYPCDDYDIEMRLSEIGSVLLLKEVLLRYRFHNGANTYSSFDDMQEKTRWVAECYRRRRQHQPEPSWESFLESRRASPNDRNERRADAARWHMRVAGQRYLDGHDLRAAAHFCASTALDPLTVVRRLDTALRHLFMKRGDAGGA